jgi:hypothetical protein
MVKINGDCTKEVPSRLEVMHNHIIKEKSIYNVINMLQQREANYIGFCWAPVDNQAEMERGLEPFK